MYTCVVRIWALCDECSHRTTACNDADPVAVYTGCRAIDRAGGLDRYLLKTPDAQLHSDVASKLKFRLSTIYWHKEHEAKQQRQLQQRPGLQQLGPGQSPLAAVQAAQRQALAAGGTSIGAHRSCSSLAGSLLPPIAAAEFAAAAAAGWLRHS